MFDAPLPEIEDHITRAMPPLPPIFEQPPAVEKTNAIAAGIVGVQTEVARFDQIAAGLKAIEDAHPKNVIVAAIDTAAGMKAAETAWRAYRNPRLEVERARKAAKAPVLALGKAIDAFAGGLEDRLRVGEDHYKAQIDAEEARKAAIKAEQERIEREAAEKHAARRAAISMYAMRCQEPGMTAERIAAGMQRLEGADLSDADSERATELAALRVKTLESMRTMHAQAVAREAEAHRQEQIRAENERVAAELAAERQRIADEAAAIRRQAEELAAARVVSASTDTGTMLQDECRDLSIALATKPDAMMHARDAAAAIAREDQIHAAAAQAMVAEAGLLTINPPAGEIIGATSDPAEIERGLTDEPVADDEPAEVTMSALANQLGFRLTEEFVRDRLGVTPKQRDGRAVLFTQSQRRQILSALARHVQALM